MQWMLMQNADMEWYEQSYPLFEKVDVNKKNNNKKLIFAGCNQLFNFWF